MNNQFALLLDVIWGSMSPESFKQPPSVIDDDDDEYVHSRWTRSVWPFEKFISFFILLIFLFSKTRWEFIKNDTKSHVNMCVYTYMYKVEVCVRFRTCVGPVILVQNKEKDKEEEDRRSRTAAAALASVRRRLVLSQLLPLKPFWVLEHPPSRKCPRFSAGGALLCACGAGVRRAAISRAPAEL